ncbi:MAG: DNA polymerase I [Gammaproteobacteria bacterium]|nr:DNA polymerase I [Gammaproteobacteria bacterium]
MAPKSSSKVSNKKSKSKKSAPIILVDGSSYLFRAFHAMPPLTNSKGLNTGAVYGVINMLKKLQDEYQPESMAVIFDAKGKTFRHDLYQDYKANRPPMPDDLREQIEPLHQLVQALGYPMLVVEGVEADDVIGTLAKKATESGAEMLISTGDKDMAQLVSEHVTLINTMTNSLMDPDGVVSKFDVRADQIIDYLALVGDSVDNIPGVPKVGPKTAAKWLKEYGSLQQIIDNADKFKGKIGDNLRHSLDHLPLSYQLATIDCELQLEAGLQDLNLQAADKERLKELYSELEFNSWLRQLNEASDDSQSTDKPQKNELSAELEYETVLELAQFENWLKQLSAADSFVFDTETTSLNYMQAKVVGVSFAVEAFKAAYVPFAHSYEGAPEQLSEAQVLGALKPLLEDPNKGKIGQNLKYDKHVLMNHGIVLQGISDDSMLESYVLDSTSRHDMDTLALKYLGVNTIHFEDVAGKGAKQISFDKVTLEQAGPYAAEDADITFRLHQSLAAKLAEQESLQTVYREIELPLLDVLQKIEHIGVKVDVDMLQQQSAELEVSIKAIEAKAYELAGEEFNLASPKQIQHILFEKMDIPVIRKTPKGQPSTAEDVLQELAEEYELPKLLLESRSLSKLKSTYTDKLPKMVDPVTGRVHTSYHQAVAATGRLSSTDPNLQNIPIRSAEGRRIRQAFIPETGRIMMAADYSQIELRIMAHLSADQGLLTAFKNDLDVHSATAAEVFGLALDKVGNEQRRAAKAINFGLIYGMSAFGLAKQLNISRFDAQDYIDVYFERYPGVKAYMDQTRAQAHDDGYVETVYGRRLYLPEINSRNGMRRQYAERTAINAPMQGSAADIIKRAMIAVDKEMQNSSFDALMVMQVHDELVFEVATDQLAEFSAMVTQQMQAAAELAVPLIVSVDSGNNWDEAH